MFNIFKETKSFTSYLKLHNEIENKMSKLAAENAMNTLRVVSMQDIINKQIDFNCYSGATLVRAAAQMEDAVRIMTKATATLITNQNHGHEIAFNDKTIYEYIMNAKSMVSASEVDTTMDRETAMYRITNNAKTLMSLERSMVMELTEYAKKAGQAVTVRG